MVDRYYNSWIENTDQAVDDDVSQSTVSAGQFEPSNQPEVRSPLSVTADHPPVSAEHRSAGNEMSDWNMSTTPSDDDDDDDDDDEDDDNDVFRSFM